MNERKPKALTPLSCTSSHHRYRTSTKPPQQPLDPSLTSSRPPRTPLYLPAPPPPHKISNPQPEPHPSPPLPSSTASQPPTTQSHSLKHIYPPPQTTTPTTVNLANHKRTIPPSYLPITHLSHPIAEEPLHFPAPPQKPL